MKLNPKFLSDLEVTPLRDGKNWRLTHRLEFLDARGEFHVVPAGFVTDFASVPPLSRIGIAAVLVALLGSYGSETWHWPWLECLFLPLLFAGALVCWLDADFCDDDRLDGPATLHDEGYRRPRLGRRPWKMKFYWDGILFQALRANGVPYWKAWLIWFNVAVFGWLAWHQDGRKNHPLEDFE